MDHYRVEVIMDRTHIIRDAGSQFSTPYKDIIGLIICSKLYNAQVKLNW